MTPQEAKEYIYDCLDHSEATEVIKALEQQPCEDCISRQVVKDMLTAEWTKYMPMELDMNLSFILDKISELPSVTPKSEWIPVSERLPEEYCLFCDIDGDVYYGHIYDKKWWAEGQNDRIKNVTAWMPLPQPYKAESEGK